MRDGHITRQDKRLSVLVNVHHVNIMPLMKKNSDVTICCLWCAPQCYAGDLHAEHKTMGIITSSLMSSDRLPVVSDECLQ